MKILVTGTAGFIGFHLAKRLAERGDEVFGLDSINDYYDVRLKYARLKEAGIAEEDIGYGKYVASSKYNNYRFVQLKLEDRQNLFNLLRAQQFDAVCNLAAQAGVRYSLENPYAYIDSNIVGFLNILEGCRQYHVDNLCFASSSSVYGLNTKVPFSTKDNVDHPVSLYAATKKADELMAHTYSHLYGIRATGLRFFTVYGPWGRPDMAYYKFVKAAFEDKPIEVYNNGEMQRDFTYIDDIVEGVVRVIDKPAEPSSDFATNPSPDRSSAPYRIYNIGNNHPVQLFDFIAIIETILNKKIEKHFLPMQKGDVLATYADIENIRREFDFNPSISITDGMNKFIGWYKDNQF
ncbi:MAG: dTDP-glucose 4,6-dehydratase [Spirochaetes bacterium ADurb.Bin110]|nr:MAG: dTDP-glucose 4,6-dehydratase [Spirochaetes bacterium ADurb.Bin110]